MGELRYIADCTRPDIAFIVNRLTAATHNPTNRHWLHLKRFMRYLAGTRNDGIMYTPGQHRDAMICFVNDPSMSRRTHPIQTFSDADFAGDESDRKSTSELIHLFNNGPIAWTSTKQSMQALSTCEAEYIAATTAVHTTLWLRRLLSELSLLPRSPTRLLVDNKGAIAIATNTARTKKRKFIDLRHHYLREHINLGNIIVAHVPSSQIADILTKPLGAQKYAANKTSIAITARQPRPTKSYEPVPTAPDQEARHYAQA